MCIGAIKYGHTECFPVCNNNTSECVKNILLDKLNVSQGLMTLNCPKMLNAITGKCSYAEQKNQLTNGPSVGCVARYK